MIISDSRIKRAFLITIFAIMLASNHTTHASSIPKIELAGWWDTDVSFSHGGTLKMVAVANSTWNGTGLPINRIELYYQGVPTGVLLNSTDTGPVQVLFSMAEIPISAGVPPGLHFFQLVPSTLGGQLTVWPELSSLDATPTPMPTPVDTNPPWPSGLPTRTPTPIPPSYGNVKFFMKDQNGLSTVVEYTPSPAVPGQYGDFSENTIIRFEIQNYTPIPNHDYVIFWEESTRSSPPLVPNPSDTFRYQKYYYDAKAGGVLLGKPPQGSTPSPTPIRYPIYQGSLVGTGFVEVNIESHSFCSFPEFDGIDSDYERTFQDGVSSRADITPDDAIIKAEFRGQEYTLSVPQWVDHTEIDQLAPDRTIDWLEARVKAIRTDSENLKAYPWMGDLGGQRFVMIWDDDLATDCRVFNAFRATDTHDNCSPWGIYDIRNKSTYANSESIFSWQPTDMYRMGRGISLNRYWYYFRKPSTAGCLPFQFGFEPVIEGSPPCPSEYYFCCTSSFATIADPDSRHLYLFYKEDVLTGVIASEARRCWQNWLLRLGIGSDSGRSQPGGYESDAAPNDDDIPHQGVETDFCPRNRVLPGGEPSRCASGGYPRVGRTPGSIFNSPNIGDFLPEVIFPSAWRNNNIILDSHFDNPLAIILGEGSGLVTDMCNSAAPTPQTSADYHQADLLPYSSGDSDYHMFSQVVRYLRGIDAQTAKLPNPGINATPFMGVDTFPSTESVDWTLQGSEWPDCVTPSPTPTPRVKIVIDGSEIASGHCAFITDAPQMPAMLASFDPPQTNNVNVRWRAIFAYETEPARGEYFFGSVYPSTGYTTLPGNQSWNINAEMGTDIRGGTVLVEAQIVGGPTYYISFGMRGTNPEDSAAKSYINSQPNVTWYAYAIAKHESYEPLRPSERYNQFNVVGQYNCQWDDIDKMPNWGYGNSICRGGFGLFQLDNFETSSSSGLRCINDDELWNWEENVKTGIQVINLKYTRAQSRQNRFQTNYPQDYVHPPALHVGGYQFSTGGWNTTPPYNSIWLDAIKRYNGGTFWSFRPDEDPSWQPGQPVWNHVPISNDYTEKVMVEL